MFVGCNPQGAAPVANPPANVAPVVAAPPAAPKPPELRFELSDTAAKRVKEIMATLPQKPALVVWVDFDDEKFCTGFHYNLKFEQNPDPAHYTMVSSQDIHVAVDQGDVNFLNGTTLDFATLESGTAGFVFRNPNENVSLVPELRGKESSRPAQN